LSTRTAVGRDQSAARCSHVRSTSGPNPAHLERPERFDQDGQEEHYDHGDEGEGQDGLEEGDYCSRNGCEGGCGDCGQETGDEQGGEVASDDEHDDFDDDGDTLQQRVCDDITGTSLDYM